MADVTGPGIRIPILADASPFMKGMDKALGKMQGFAQKLQKFSKGMVIAGGAATAMFALGTKKAIAFGTSIDKMAEATGVAHEQISKLSFAVGQYHGSTEALEKAMKRLAYAMSETKDGMATYKDEFDRLGLSVVDAEGKLKSVDDMFYELADHIAALGDDTQALASIQQILGRSGMDLLPILKQGGDALRQQGDLAERLGLVLDSETSKALETLGTTLGNIKKAILGLATTALKPMIADLQALAEKAMNAIATATTWMKEHAEFTRKMVKTVAILGGASVALGAIGLVLPQIVAGFAALKAIGLTGASGGLIGAGLALIGLLVWKVPSVLAVIGGAVRLIGREISIWAARIAAIFVKGFGWLPGIGGRGARAAGEWVSAQLAFMLKEQESDWNALFDIFEGKSKALPWEKAADNTRKGGETIAGGIEDMGGIITDAIDDTTQQILQAQEALMATLTPKKTPSAMYDPTKPGGTWPLFGKGLPGTALPEFRVPLEDLRKLMQRSKDPMGVLRGYVARMENVAGQRAGLRERGYPAPAFPWEGKPFSALEYFAVELKKLAAKPTVDMEVHIDAANMEEIGELVREEIEAALAAGGMNVDTSLMGD